MVNRTPMLFALVLPLFLLMVANVANAQAVGQAVNVSLLSNPIPAGGSTTVLADITGLNFYTSTIAYNWSVAPSTSCPGFSNPGNAAHFTYASTAPTSNCAFTVSVSDGSGDTGSGTSSALTATPGTTPPTITGTSAGISDTAATPAGSVENYTLPTATDQYGTAITTVSCSPASGSTFSIGTTTVTCTATDAYGNAASTTFPVTISAGANPPTITGTPANYVDPNVAANGSGSVENYTLPTATDQYGTAITTVSCSPASGSIFPIGTTTVTCTATDANGNAASTTFTVKVNAGTAPPVITGTPTGIADTATTSAGAVESWTAPTATDQYGAVVTVSCLPASGSTFPIEMTTVVTCTATDANGITASATFPVTISAGTAPPVITGVPADIADTATTSAGAVESWTAPTATDQYGTPLDVSCADPSGSLTSGSTFPIGTTTVTCSATDAYHNQGSASFTITVNPVTTTTISPINASTNSTAASNNTTAETTVATTVAPTNTTAQVNATAAAVAASAPMTPSASNNYLMAAIVLVAAAALFLVYSRFAKRNSWRNHKKRFKAR